MSPLHVESYYPKDKKWIKLGSKKPGEGRGFLFDNFHKEIIVYECKEDDSGSTIKKSKETLRNVIIWRKRKIDSSDFKIVKELKPNESFEVKIKSDIDGISRRIKFSHF